LSLVHFFFSRPSPLPVPPPLPYSTLFRSPALSRWWVGPRAAASSLRPALPGCTGSSSQDHADPALITPPRYLLCSPEPSGTGWLACRARYDSLPPVVDDPGGVVTGSREASRGSLIGTRPRRASDRVGRSGVTWMPSSEAAGQASLTTWPHRPWEDLMISEHDSVDVFIGIDVGKSDHHAVGIDRAGKKLLDKPLPQDEAKHRALISKVSVPGTCWVVVDQPATIGALPVAVAQDMGVMVGYLPGLAMRRIADLHPGQAKTDARDAAIIAEAARSMPHTLRSIALADEQ